MDNNLNFNQQMQNPNMASSPRQTLIKGKKMWIWVSVAVAIVVAGLVWYFGARQGVLPPLPIPTPTPEAGVQLDVELSSEVENVDLGDLESEFKDIDADLNSL